LALVFGLDRPGIAPSLVRLAVVLDAAVRGVGVEDWAAAGGAGMATT
jgi:hypothetical protein